MRTKQERVAADVDPRFWEPTFRTYIQSPTVPISSLLNTYERRAFRGSVSDDFNSTQMLIKLNPPHLAALKRQIAQRIAEEGGEFRTPTVWFRSSDGLTFTTHLPGG